MRLYLIRHADPDYPNKTITPLGHQEAKALSERMAQEGLSRIYTSPMGRARHTAQYTADVTGLHPTVLPWAQELEMIAKITALNGQSRVAWGLEGEVIRGGEEFPHRDNWHQLPQLAEFDYRAHYQKLVADSNQFLEDLGYKREGGIYRVLNGNEDRVAIFCHHGFALYWIAHLLEIPLPFAWCGFYLAPSSVSIILMETHTPDIAVPRVLRIGDISHIYAAGLAESRHGIRANFN